MLNTPHGMRSLTDYEFDMLAYGASKLSSYINARIKSDERKTVHEGVVLKAVREDSAFHALIPQAQLCLLYRTFNAFSNQDDQNQMTQFANAALECLYSCIFYEIKKDIESHRASLSTPNRRNVRFRVVSAWEHFGFQREYQIKLDHTNLDDWLTVVDKLASRSVFDHNFAKQFDPGYLPDITEQEIINASQYFEMLI